MEIVKTGIGNAITSEALDHIVATADDIYDENLNKYQEDINKLLSGHVKTIKDNVVVLNGEVESLKNDNKSLFTYIQQISGTTKSVQNSILRLNTEIVNINNRIDGIVSDLGDLPARVSTIENRYIYSSNSASDGEFLSFEDTPVWKKILYSLSLSSNNDDYGYVIGGGQYVIGTNVLIKAVANEMYQFVKWSDDNTDSTRSVLIENDKSLVATFIKVKFEVKLTCNSEEGTVSGGGIYNIGDEIEISATPKIGYKFVQWNDGSTEATRIITVDSDIELAAEFVRVYTICVGSESTVLLPYEPAYIEETGTQIEEFEYGTEITLVADDVDGFEFTKWSDDITDKTRQLTVTEDASYTAIYRYLSGDKIYLTATNNIYDFRGSIIEATLDAETGNYIFEFDGKTTKIGGKYVMIFKSPLEKNEIPYDYLYGITGSDTDPIMADDAFEGFFEMSSTEFPDNEYEFNLDTWICEPNRGYKIICDANAEVYTIESDYFYRYERIKGSDKSITTDPISALVVCDYISCVLDGDNLRESANNKINVTIDNDIIYPDVNEGIRKHEFSIYKSGNYVRVKSISTGEFIYGKSGENKLLISPSDPGDSDKSSMIFDDNGVVIYTSNSTKLLYNSANDQNRFRFYKSGTYRSISLYKKVWYERQ